VSDSRSVAVENFGELRTDIRVQVGVPIGEELTIDFE
jgi:hypothetical protein